MDIKNLINKIIPPSDYEHRNGFNNIPLIEKLDENEKLELEKALIQNLLSEVNGEVDTLVVETLSYLKSTSSLPTLMDLLRNYKNFKTRLIIATAIFHINQDPEMIDIAIESFKMLDDKKSAYYVYSLTDCFDYLASFNTEKVVKLIEEYTKRPEYLISYNAKRVLNLIT